MAQRDLNDMPGSLFNPKPFDIVHSRKPQQSSEPHQTSRRVLVQQGEPQSIFMKCDSVCEAGLQRVPGLSGAEARWWQQESFQASFSSRIYQ